MIGMGLNAELVYEARSTLVGKVGELRIENHATRTKYVCDVQVRLSGVVAFFSGKRHDRFRSEGRIEKGRYRTRRLVYKRWDHDKHEIKIYSFDYAKRVIRKKRKNWKKKKLIETRESKLKYFTSMDIVAAYYNAVRDIFAKGAGRYSYKVAGAEDAGGVIDVVVPSKWEQAKLKKKYRIRNVTMVYCSMKGEVLHKKNRRIVAALDKKGVVVKAWFKVIPIVGNLVFIRKK
jgi:hypothetical protein